MFRRLRNKISDYKFDKRMAKQRYKKGFADCDCWAMDYWLCDTFPKMILRLRDMKHGAPEHKFEEYNTLPNEWKEIELSKYKKLQEKEGYEYDPNSIFTKWYIILTRIAYCLQEANIDKDMYNPYEKEYHKAIWGDIDKTKSIWETCFKKTNKGYEVKHNEVDPKLEKAYFDYEEKNFKYKEQLKNEALDLLKKYFYNLWD